MIATLPFYGRSACVRFVTASKITSISHRAPSPSSQHWSNFELVGRMWYLGAPSFLRIHKFFSVKGSRSISVFMAGAINTGVFPVWSIARIVCIKKSSVMPCTIFAIVLAVAGAMSATVACLATSICRMWPRSLDAIQRVSSPISYDVASRQIRSLMGFERVSARSSRKPSHCFSVACVVPPEWSIWRSAS